MRLPFLFMSLLCLVLLNVPLAKADTEFDDTHIRITADKPAIIHLEQEASSVIIGNPAHATAVLDNENTLIINPLRPGATSLVVLDMDGSVILQKQLLINPPANNYMRINRVCSASARETCRETSLYYCAGGCYEMILPNQDVQGGQASNDDGAEADSGNDAEENAADPAPAALPEGYTE